MDAAYFSMRGLFANFAVETKKSFYDMFAAIRHYPVTTLFVAVILVVCMIPIPETPLSDVSLIDKWTHVAMYVALEVVFFTELNRNRASLGTAALLVATVVAPAALGALVELMQAYLTTCRSGEWADFVADCVGVAVGALLGRFVITPVFRHIRRR